MSFLSLLTKAGITGAVVTFSYGTAEDVIKGLLSSVEVNAAMADMRMLHGKLMEYYTSFERYPRTKNEMVTYLKNEFDTDLEIVLTDPWMKQYNFFVPKYEIHSNGPDIKPQTKDDLGVEYPKNVKRPF